jgi:hypothetical protein
MRCPSAGERYRAGRAVFVAVASPRRHALGGGHGGSNTIDRAPPRQFTAQGGARCWSMR